ncbi:MAG TPA: hypothetical protein VEF72_24215 [Mycobacterium sp.]|nr:hypothetical protein [Mycobacterium sp.]
MSRKTVLLFPGQRASLPGALRNLTREVSAVARTSERPADFRLSDLSTMGKAADFVFGALVAEASSAATAHPSISDFDQARATGIAEMEQVS